MSKRRLTEEMSAVMRQFMAYAVLFQDAAARQAGVNSTDLQCLSLLMMNGPMTPGALSDHTGLSAGGAITAVIDRLERAGLARRTRATDDRRKVLVTPDSEEAWRRLKPLYEGVTRRWQDYLDTLTEDQLRLAIRLFTAATEINQAETRRLLTRAAAQNTQGKG
jgi:DNA-binding MarR family transcriptional regulator